MSTPTATLPSPAVRIAVVASSAESTEDDKHVTSAELIINRQRYRLIHDGEAFSQRFPTPITLSSESQVIFRYRRSRFSWKKAQTLDVQPLLTSVQGVPTQDLSLVQGGFRVTFTCQAPLPPTTQSMLEDCPRFRILVIGKAGVGKSNLIRTAFGIEKAHSADLERGTTDIEQGLESSANERFILHDSLGFEPGEKTNYTTVENFIRSRQTGPLKDQLHAVWFCIQTPYAGGRMLEAAAEKFFRSKQETMGPIPLIVVYTKFDLAVLTEFTAQESASSSGDYDAQRPMEQARLKAKSIVQAQHDEISQLAEEPVPYAVVSTKKNYGDTLENLIDMTYQEVGRRNTPEAQTASIVTLMAQRIDARLKIRGSIDVGRKRYWKALRTSPDFAGHTIWDCLSVIHADIVSLWNFNDPNCHLSDDKFKELVIEMVQMLQLPPANPRRIWGALALSGGSLIAAVTGCLGAISNPAAPIVLPIVAGLAAVVWLYDVYQNVKNVQQIFMAFIVDLTHVMETLFFLTAGEHNKLTRTAIKFACERYRQSSVIRQAHARIRTYRDVDGRDAALETIESLIKTEVDSNVQDYYAEIGKLNVRELKSDQEGDW